jgi:lipoprotein-anchoring transpeptidase ErfK/SrfK
MPHPLLLGALASVVRASDLTPPTVLQDVAPARPATQIVADSVQRSTASPAGAPGSEATTWAGAAAPSSAGVASPGGEGAAYVPPAAAPATASTPTARASAPATEAAAARLPVAPSGTVAPPRLAPGARAASAGEVDAVVMPPLVGERARYRAADPYVVRSEHIADSIVVEKQSRTLTLFRQGAKVRVYEIALGGQPAGHKVQRGDKRTPEGLYYIEARNPHSRYHLALRVSYPNTFDLWRARALGVPPGGDIMIHGLPNGQGYVGEAHRQDNWTEGCIAVTNQEIEEIWRSVPVGTPIQIKP